MLYSTLRTNSPFLLSLLSPLLTNHSQMSAIWCLELQIRRCLAIVGKCHCKWTHLFSPTLTDNGQTSATFCLWSKIGRRLAVVGTHQNKRTHPHRPWTDVGNFLSPVKNRPTSGRRRYMSWYVDSPIVLLLSNVTFL